MQINLFFTPLEIDKDDFAEKVAVVIDVLRAGTSIIYALSNGATSVIPASSIEHATKLASALDRTVTRLCGEREGKKIDGFDFGNSPLEFTQPAVQGKTLIFATTNGTPAITKTEDAKETYIASFVNISEVANRILRQNHNVMILCSGKENRFSLEDAVCGGMLISKLEDKIENCQLNDGAIAGRILYGRYANSLFKMIKSSDHGKYLESIGMAEDLKVCSTIDVFNIIPIFKEGKIILEKQK